MNKKIKAFLFVFMILLGSLLLVGCGSHNTTTKKNSGGGGGGATDPNYDYSNREDTVAYFHYYRYKGDYDGWDLWCWNYKPTNGAGKGYEFVTSTEDDGFGGVVATVKLSKNVTQLGFIIRKGGDKWAGKDIERDRYVVIPNNANKENPVHVYILEADVEFTVNEVAKIKQRLISASFKNETTIVTNATTSIIKDNIKIYKGEDEITISSSSLSTDKMTATIVISSKVDYEAQYTIYERFEEEESTIPITFDGLYDYEGFQNAFNYDGELGVSIKDGKTKFRVWAPVSTNAKLVLYSTGTTSGDSDRSHAGSDDPIETIQMTKDVKGTWVYESDKNLHGTYYTFAITTGGVENEVIDPYAYACGVNGKRGLIVDFSQINPAGWEYNHRANTISKENDAVIYELHVRDMTISKTWNGKSKAGTFKALAESGTTYSKDNVTVKTGFDHIKELGVNTVQILPFFDWSDDVDETQLNNSSLDHYSWGYMPLNYNCLEGSYSTDPYNGFTRIIEFKEMVMAYTAAGIRINMDVVYNHVANAASSSFNLIVPNYYFRTDSEGNFTNGSGCGNETASERYMMSKFMVDSCKFWAYEYNLSGFRFDLMGLHDTDTMNAIARTVKSLDSTIMVYGEPWTGSSTPLDGSRQAKIENIEKMPQVGTFNDNLRDAIKGDAGNPSGWGWIQGAGGSSESDELVNKIKSGLAGTFSYAKGTPNQVINYVACHDNNTLYDKLDSTKYMNSRWGTDRIIKMVKASYAMVILGQGVPFILNGDEFLRTKTKADGSYDENSVHSGDKVNAIDWSYKIKYLSLFNYIKGLIEIRKNHPSFRLASGSDVASSIEFMNWGNDWIVFKLNNSKSNDSYKNILFVVSHSGPFKGESGVGIGSISGNWKMFYNPEGYVTDTSTVTKFDYELDGVYLFYSD